MPEPVPSAPWPVVVEQVERDVVNDLFVRWQHPLGAVERPFGHRSHVLRCHGEIVAANGNVYRFDGWTKVKDCKRSSPGKGSTWAKGSATDAIGDGIKGLYVYRFPAQEVAA